jgi:hypothetical protein
VALGAELEAAFHVLLRRKNCWGGRVMCIYSAEKMSAIGAGRAVRCSVVVESGRDGVVTVHYLVSIWKSS